ncbi:MAG: hypothetical protein NC420_15050 [Eubacterium sp.]|nr:hypothetical protein [Eubacterium sp.]MCM1217076.1 hypothetical protein [Lachnospiraceae bacterium]MCM1304682.1 hypothetical protein [Butyrivibrio sp.]MCM1344974.1 hypothetical protein [Muribaculaceae bacterium]MCM1239144.1 hypothetical protein [Lachnospiraceae bacterium]
MDKKITGIVGYLTWFGWLVAFFAGDKEGARFHLNQSLVLWLAETVIIVFFRVTHFIPLVGWILRLFMGICQIAWLVLLILALIDAVRDEEKPLPLIGSIQILK